MADESLICSQCGARLASVGEACPACLFRAASTENVEWATLSAAETRLTPPGRRSAETSAFAGLPETVGPYRIVRLLGEGGMGVVYLADQTEPIRRRVALKVIKLGMDTRQVVARFDAERQTLALMDHPNIARVIDAGATPDGRPYFVMEYVVGVPITEYCDARRFSMRARLELLAQVCGAVQHAHQKGVIHRDLKPSNVLVAEQDGTAVPKVIDFGIAKATQQTLTERTLTEQGQFVGTPEYMSPEQAGADGVEADATTDIYSLGVMLYELLVGALPFDPAALRRAGNAEMRRIIREDEPPKPSTRISAVTSSDVASHRQTDAASLRRQLAGDLDWITLKAIEKDRTRRYASASELAADIGRYLSHEPVLASPPSATYRAKKFVRRNRLMVTAATLVAGAVVSGLVVSTILYLREGRARVAEVAARENAGRMEAAAERSKGLAETAAGQEAAARRRADDQTSIAKDALALAETRLYFNNIDLAARELTANNLAQADQLLATAPARLRNWEWHYLTRRGHTEDVAISVRDMVTALQLDREGERVFVASALELRVADLRSGRVVRTTRLHGTRRVLTLSSVFSAGGRIYAAAFAPAKVIEGPDPMPTRFEIGVWDVETGRVLLSIPAPMGGSRMALSESGTRLYTWGGDSKQDAPIRVWDIAAGSQLPILTAYSGAVNALALTADGTRLAVGGHGTLRVLDTLTGRELLSTKYQGFPRNKGDLEGLIWSRDAARIAAVFPGHGLRTWGMTDSAEVWSVPPSTTGESSDSGTAFTPDGRYLVTAKQDHLLHLIDSATGKEAATFSGNPQAITGLAMSRNRARFVSSDATGALRVWSLPDADAEPQVIGAGTNQISVDVSGDSHIAALDFFGKLLVFDTRVIRHLFSWGPPARATKMGEGELVACVMCAGPRPAVSAVALNRTGSRVGAAFLRVAATSKTSGTFAYEHKVFDVTTGREIATLTQSAEDGELRELADIMKVPLPSLVLAPTGDRAVVITHRKQGADLAFWNIARNTTSVIHLPSMPSGFVRFAADGRLVAISAVTFSAVTGIGVSYAIYDATSGRRLRVFGGPGSGPESGKGNGNALAVTRDMGRLAGQTDTNEITLWDVHTGEKLVTMTCPRNSIDLAFSPDGSRLVARSVEGVISVFDTIAGRQVAALRESEASSVREWIVAGLQMFQDPRNPALHFSSDGTQIVLTTILRDPKGARVRITTWSGAPVPSSR